MSFDFEDLFYNTEKYDAITDIYCPLNKTD